MNVTNQGSYILINSTLLNYYFQNYLYKQQGVGINTFVYFSGIPWEDSPSTGNNPLVSDAVDIGYVFGNPTVVQAQDLVQCSYSLGQIPYMVGGNTPIPLNYTSTMFEYGRFSRVGSGIDNSEFGVSSGYYVMLPENPMVTFGYALIPIIIGPGFIECSLSSYNSTYYYGGSAYAGSQYYFAEFNPNSGLNNVVSSSYIPFVPLDQQNNNNYLYYGIFYTYYWYTLQNGQVNTYFLVNGNIYNNPLPKSNYQWGCSLFGCYSANAILPEPPYTYIAQSYQNAYETAFVAEENRALNLYSSSTFSAGIPSGFIDGTFGYQEQYGSVPSISPLSANAQNYQGQPYLFISAGSGGGSGYMYLDWVIATFGVPYEVTVP